LKLTRGDCTATFLREHSQRKLPGVGIPKAQDLVAHRCGYIVERRLNGATFGRHQHRRRERCKGQIGGGETLAG
jgi:hypothetical protein